jgi:steroid 5-alpha reductase family enzyme
LRAFLVLLARPRAGFDLTRNGNAMSLRAMSALHNALWACVVVSSLVWLLSVLTKEYSWVDRVWSIVPPLYAIYFAYEAGFSDPRTLAMAVLASAWGARLTYNFARKGGYAPGGEDYRWAELRKRMSPALFQLFNLVFIAFIQNFILLAITLPAWLAYEHRATPFGPYDALLCVAFLLLLAGETWADQVQWRFQQHKAAQRARGETPSEEFVTSGPFRLSRHPNFFCEQAQWWVFYGFGVVASGQLLHWTVAGAVTLTLLFHGSTNFTEALSLAKYPRYADYQRSTSRLWPWFPAR